jgi:hypothetical protein
LSSLKANQNVQNAKHFPNVQGIGLWGIEFCGLSCVAH